MPLPVCRRRDVTRDSRILRRAGCLGLDASLTAQIHESPQEPLVLRRRAHGHATVQGFTSRMRYKGKVVRRDANGFGVQFEDLEVQQIEMVKSLMK